jgi:hypothetical protein
MTSGFAEAGEGAASLYVVTHNFRIDDHPGVITPQCRLQAHPSIHQLCAHASLVLFGYDNDKYGSLQRYTFSNVFRNFKTACGTRGVAIDCGYGTSLRDSIVRVRPNTAFNESIEGFWPGRLRSHGS